MSDAALNSELVSIIVPAFNAQETITATLESALAQTYPRFEILVIDDGSRDQTREIAKRLAAQNPQVRVISQANGGVSKARNRGIAEARGSLIAPLDADDLWHPEKLATQVAAMSRGGPRMGLVYSWCAHIDSEDRVTCRHVTSLALEGSVFGCLLLGNFVASASNPLIRRSCLIEVNGYDESLFDDEGQGCEDLALYLAIAERYEFACVPRVMIGYRKHSDQMSRAALPMRRMFHRVSDDARRRHPEIPKRLFRWGKGCFYSWMAAENLRAFQFRDGIDHLIRAFFHDPGLLFRQAIWRQLACQSRKGVLRLLPKRWDRLSREPDFGMDYRLLSPDAKVLEHRSYTRRFNQKQLDLALSIGSESPLESLDSKARAKELAPVTFSE